MRAPQYSDNLNELFDQVCIENPFPMLERLRAQSPVSQIGDSGFHLVTSWKLINEVLKREYDFSSNLTGVLYKTREGLPASFDFPDTGAINVIATADGSDHARQRKILLPGFTRIAISKYEQFIRQIVYTEVQNLLVSEQGDSIPIIEKIPAAVIGGILGLPTCDLQKFSRWSMIGGSMLAGEIQSEKLEYLASETEKMRSYLTAQFDGSVNSDICNDNAIINLLYKSVERGELSKQEAIGILIILFGAGGESTSALIGSAIFYISKFPELQREIRANKNLIGIYVEEIARLQPPFKFHYRSVIKDCSLGGCEIFAGEKLLLSWDSANRDDELFEDPNTLSLHRKYPQRHMSFGRGIHFCLGTLLARLETRLVLEELIESTSNISILKNPTYLHSIFVRRLTSLNVAIDS